MTHEGRADFDGFVPQKNQRGRNFAKENYIPDIVMQAENIVNSFVSGKTNTEKNKIRRVFPFVIISALLLTAVFCIARFI